MESGPATTTLALAIASAVTDSRIAAAYSWTPGVSREPSAHDRAHRNSPRL